MEAGRRRSRAVRMQTCALSNGSQRAAWTWSGGASLSSRPPALIMLIQHSLKFPSFC